MNRTRRMRNCRSGKSKRGGMMIVDKDKIAKENILVKEIKQYIQRTDGDIPNLDSILKSAFEDTYLNESSRKNVYTFKVKQWLKQNYDSDGNRFTKSPSGSLDYFGSDSDSDDDPFEGGKSRRRRRANKKSRKIRKIRKSRRSCRR